MKQLHMFADFRAGLNLDSSPDHLAENELLVADNIDLSERGGAKKRNGFDSINTSSYGGQVTQTFDWSRDNGEIWEMSVIDRNLCKLNPITKEKIPICTVDTDKVGRFALQDNLYYLTGSDFRRYNGTSSELVPPDPDEKNNLGAIQKCKFVVRHPKSQRIFFAGNPDNRAGLYYSEPGDPTFVKETSIMYPSTGDGPITGLINFVDAVLVFFEHSIWVWRGIDPEMDAVWHKLPTNEGTLSPYSICYAKTGLLYLGKKGIINLSPSIIGMSGEVEPGKEAVFNTSADKIENLIKSIKYPEIACGAYDSKSGNYYLAYGDDSEKRNNKILVLDGNGCFVRWTGILINDIHYGLNGKLLFSGENYILENKKDWYKDITPTGAYKNVKVVIETPKYSLGSHVHKKLITRYKVLLQGQEGNAKFNLDIVIDGEVVVSKEFSERTSEDITLIREQFRRTGKRVSLRITNEDSKPFVLYGVGLEAKIVNSYGERV